MSEPTIRLPLTAAGEHIFPAANGEGKCTSAIAITWDPAMAAALVSLVNSQAERIRGLREILERGCVLLEQWHEMGEDEDITWIREARAALDKAGKEGA